MSTAFQQIGQFGWVEQIPKQTNYHADIRRNENQDRDITIKEIEWVNKICPKTK
jgi:hypothetical protein